MKTKVLLTIATLMFGQISLAQIESTTVRCTGLNSKNVQIGIDVTLDAVDRIESIATFHKESVGVVDPKELGAPSHFVKVDRKGGLLMFGLKSFNDGLEEVMSISFAKGADGLSSLALGLGAENTAVKNISCSVLK